MTTGLIGARPGRCSPARWPIFGTRTKAGIGSAGRARRLAGDGKGLACPLRGDVVEASTVAVEHRLLTSKLLPALHRNIDISRRDLDRVADAAGHLSRDYRRARAAERLVDGLPGRRIILDPPAHALHP